jgi:hypothetical protein
MALRISSSAWSVMGWASDCTTSACLT